MNNTSEKTKNRSFERQTLLILLLIFIGVTIIAWAGAMRLRQTISANNSVLQIDISALVELAKMRNIADAQLSNSRSFFLLGSTKLFDEQKKDKQRLAESLAIFEKKFNLPQIPQITQRILSLQQQNQDYFDQGMGFRAKQTESKIVGQFYQSKAGPLQVEFNKAFDELVVLHNAELERARAQSEKAAAEAQIQIPQGMALFTGVLSILFFAMTLLISRLLNERSRHVAERNRLFNEATKAINGRDEIIIAVSQDLNESLATISNTAEIIGKTQDQTAVKDGLDLIQSSVQVTEGLIKDILDQTKADSGEMTLRLEQLPIDVVLDDARLMLQSLAKQRDIRLEFVTPNPPALAFMDRGRVMRVLSNLVGNAIKFSPNHSKIIVKVRSDQQFVFVSVKDSGPGIPEKQHAEMFTHFWQARKTSEQGSGVGLAIVKTIIDAHGGAVTVESHMGHGSTFTFSLPRRRPASAHIGRPATSAVTYGTKTQTQAQEAQAQVQARLEDRNRQTH